MPILPRDRTVTSVPDLIRPGTNDNEVAVNIPKIFRIGVLRLDAY